jgi:hypothetical protein
MLKLQIIKTNNSTNRLIQCQYCKSLRQTILPNTCCKLDVLMAVTSKTAFVSNVMPYGLVEVYWNFRRPCHLCHLCSWWMETAESSAISVKFYQTTYSHLQTTEDCRHAHRSVKSNYQLHHVSVCLSSHLSMQANLAPTGQILMKFDMRILKKVSQNPIFTKIWQE